MPHTANGHNLEVIHMGYCRDCGGTSLIAGVQAQNVDAAPSPWIAVSERLPTEAGQYLTFPHYRIFDFDIDKDGYGEEGKFWRFGYDDEMESIVIGNPVSWMPLPAPPCEL